MKIDVAQKRCIGSGNCVRLAPEVFDQREDDGLVDLLVPRPRPQRWDAVREAEYQCPSRAITIHLPTSYGTEHNDAESDSASPFSAPSGLRWNITDPIQATD